MTKSTDHKVSICSIVGLLLLLLAVASFAWGKGPSKIENTVHNLSVTQPFYPQWASNVDEVCVFCHTPHGGLLTGPLWNHSMPAADSFTHYNSVTLSDYLQGLNTKREVNEESLLCMACHDGSVAVDHLINDPNSLGVLQVKLWEGAQADVDILPLLNGMPGKRIGGSMNNPGGFGDLSDDHPISFSYDEVYGDYQLTSRAGELNDSATITDVRFFRAENNVECSSCHDPHVDYVNNPEYTPFLIMSNSGSALCLACHNK